MGISRSTYRYGPETGDREKRLVEEMVRLKKQYPRYGYRRIHQLLRRGGWRDGRHRIARLWRREGFQVPVKQAKRRRAGESTGIRQEATHPKHVWSWDIISDRLADGRKLRILCVLDEFTREALQVQVGHHVTSELVVEVLQALMARRGAPEHIRSDNGPEFVATRVQEWFAAQAVKTIYITPGSPWENPYIESFNSRFRDELLDRELFGSLPEAQVVIEDWRDEYNHVRPHSSLQYQTPTEFAQRGPKTCGDFSHSSIPAGGGSETNRSGGEKHAPRVGLEDNEATGEELLRTQSRRGSLAAPPACRIRTDRGAQVASPQSPILRAGHTPFSEHSEERNIDLNEQAT
jgi:transposase InsO family protein